MTDNQSTILQAIQAFIDVQGFSPTIREIALMAGLPQSSAYVAIKQLERQGHITRQPGKARSIAIAKPPPKGG
jgi:SOS-response transcriptional repressor LexA